jgi:UDP-N-acetylmuramate--alanine ligase
MSLPKRIHLIGIGGTGLSAIARVLLEKGHTVSGSDRQLSELAGSLQAAGARVYSEHAAEHVRECDLVIRSSAIPDNNPEVVEAQRLGIPVLKRETFMRELMGGKTVIAVAGSHGKTTTSAMLSWVFSALGQSPSFIVGGVLNDLGVNAHAGTGPYFIIEADEYDRMFHGLRPDIAIITNVEHDHPDCYPSAEDFYQAFAVFAGLIPAGGSLVFCGDDGGATRLAMDAPGAIHRLAYGIGHKKDAGEPRMSSERECVAKQVQPSPLGGYRFEAEIGGEAHTVELRVPGVHNVRNALGVFAVASICGLDLAAVANALGQFNGVARRFEVRGEAAGVTIVDDYGHHPTEIRATLAGARARYPGRRILAIWQPHTYSRTQALFDEFTSAFGDADLVIVTEIYASREQPPADGTSSRRVVDAINQAQGALRGNAYFASKLETAATLAMEMVRAGDVLVVLSAGDATWISQRVFNQLQERKETHV